MRALMTCLLILLSAGSVRAQTALEQFDAYLAQLRREKGIPALSAAIVKDGQILWTKAYGFADDEGDVRADEDTTFYIASVTKPIAATAILAEAAAGKLALSTPLAAGEGWAEACRWLAASKIPFGGGGRDVDGAVLAPVSCDRGLTVADALHMRANGPAGSGFVYNPIIYARIDRAIEGAGGRSLMEMVRGNVLKPAGMEDVALGWRDPDAGAAHRRIAPPFRVTNGEREKTPTPDDDLRAAAGIYASPKQLARFDIAFDTVLLPPNWRAGIVQTPPEAGYAYGWFHERWRGRKLLWHSGHEPDAYSALYLKVPDERLTLIVLANTDAVRWGNPLSRADVASSPIAQRFLNLFLSPAQRPAEPRAESL